MFSVSMLSTLAVCHQSPDAVREPPPSEAPPPAAAAHAFDAA